MELELERAKKIIKSIAQDPDYILECEQAERYYRGINDITFPEKVPKPWIGKTASGGLRRANNRVANTYYSYLVNQKASYLCGEPVQFDTGNKAWNKKINIELGGHWSKTCKHLVINAANYKTAWLHSWIDEDNDFHYGVVDSKQIIPYWGDKLNNKLLLLVRTYELIDTDGETYTIYEIWDDKYCHFYQKKSSFKTLDYLQERLIFKRWNPDLNIEEYTNRYEHGFTEIPFSAFNNNSLKLNDLMQIKGYLDTYDKAFSLFLDNLEDIQQVIFVLENLGGTDVEDFLRTLRETGVVKVINEEALKTDLRTITLEIPTEASTTLLGLARKNIFEQGQGIDPNPESYAGNTSGEALKYMYANLELKAVLTEDEFRIGFDHFMRRLCEYLNINPDIINQIWERTRINNETELINNLKNSEGLLSLYTRVSKHPYTDDPEAEFERLQQEKQDRQMLNDTYQGAFNDQPNPDQDEVNNEQQ